MRVEDEEIKKILGKIFKNDSPKQLRIGEKRKFNIISANIYFYASLSPSCDHSASIHHLRYELARYLAMLFLNAVILSLFNIFQA